MINCKSEKKVEGSTENQLIQTLYYGGDIITIDGDTPQYIEAVMERNRKIIIIKFI